MADCYIFPTAKIVNDVAPPSPHLFSDENQTFGDVANYSSCLAQYHQDHCFVMDPTSLQTKFFFIDNSQLGYQFWGGIGDRFFFFFFS